MRAIRSAAILLMIAGSTMAASPIVDPKGLSCSDRTPPATSSPVSATRPAFPRPSLPILLFGSPLRKLQPSQLAIEAAKNAEAAKPKRAANDAAPKTLNLLSLPPIPHWLLEGLPTPPGAPSPSPLAPSPVALIMEDSPPTLPPSPHSHDSHESPPCACPKTPDEASIYFPDSPPDHPLGEPTGGNKFLSKNNGIRVRSRPGARKHPLRLVFPQLARHYMRAEWQRHPEPQITGRTERQVWRRLQLAQLCTRHPWWR